MKTNIKFKFEEFRRGTLGNIHEIKMSRDGELRQRDTEGPYEISFLKQTSTETQEFCLLLYLQDFHLEFTDNSLLFTPTGDIQRAFRFCTKTTHHYNRQVWRGPIEDTYKGQFALCNFLKDGATKKLYDHWWQVHGSSVPSNTQQLVATKEPERKRSRSASPTRNETALSSSTSSKDLTVIRPALPLSHLPSLPTLKETARPPSTSSNKGTASLSPPYQLKLPLLEVTLPDLALTEKFEETIAHELDATKQQLLIAHYKLQNMELDQVKEQLSAAQIKNQALEKELEDAKRHIDDTTLSLQQMEAEAAELHLKIGSKDKIIGLLEKANAHLEAKLERS